VGQQGWLNDSRYQTSAKTDTTKKSEYAFVNLRYKLPNQQKSILLNQPVKMASTTLSQANNDTRFAIAVASYAQQLKGGQYNGAMGWDQIIQLAQQSAKPDPFEMREEFVDLVKIAKSLSAKKE
jgi:Ca-activated chloride channel family protein